MSRIAMISEHASPLADLGGPDGGGQNVYVGMLARHLARLGHEIDVFTRRESHDLPEVVAFAPGVRVIQVTAGPVAVLPKEQLLPFMADFAGEVVRFAAVGPGYDIAHAHFFMSGLVGLELKARLGVPLVVTFHALGRVRRLHQKEADGFPDERFLIEDRLVREADRIVAECPQDEHDLITLYGADPERLAMVPCGFDADEFAPVDKQAARRALGLPADETIVLQLGRMVPRKGVDTVIRGFARALPGIGKARLRIVGGGSAGDKASIAELARLRGIAEEEAVGDAVDFVGARPRAELRLHYAAADMFVTTPWYEPFGITPLEAMACARPVIAAEVGGLKYTVVDGDTGLHVPPRDADAVGKAIGALAANPDMGAAMGRAGLVRVRDLFTWSGVATRMAGLYGEVMAESRVTALDGEERVGRAFDELAATLARARTSITRQIAAAADLMAETLLAGGKLLVCGNGGSAADAQHFAAEFVGRFKRPGRRALPVIALAADTAFVTAWANDVGYADIFSRGVEAYGQPGDLLLAISTSGRSPNILKALATAQERGLRTVSLLGGAPSSALPLSDMAVRVPSNDTARVQEVQMLALHLICELVEERIVAHDADRAATLPLAASGSLTA